MPRDLLIELEKKLWSAADELRANSELKSSEYSVPVLGLIFLKYADVRFAQSKKALEGKGSGRRTIGKTDYHAKGVLYLPETVRLCRMNLAVHGISGDVKQGNNYYEDILESLGRFDFVMANSDSDARGSELEIPRQLIQSGVVDVMVAIGSNFF